jgi:hypothetical protein
MHIDLTLTYTDDVGGTLTIEHDGDTVRVTGAGADRTGTPPFVMLVPADQWRLACADLPWQLIAQGMDGDDEVAVDRGRPTTTPGAVPVINPQP